MKILLVHNLYRDYGGEETYLFSLADLLKKKGHKVQIWTKDNKEIDTSISAKVKVGLGLFWNLNTTRELSAIIKKFKPNIVHFNNIFPLITPTAYHVCKKFNLPIVQTVHNFRYLFPKSILFRRGSVCELCLDRRFFYPAIFHPCYNQSLGYTFLFSLSHALHDSIFNSFNLVDRFIFPSKFSKNYYLKNSKLNREKARVVSNFVRVDANTKLGKKSDYFLYVGRFSPEKGIIQLLEIFSRNPDKKLKVIGDGPLRKQVINYSKNKNIEVHNFMQRKKVLGFMKKALFLIIPSVCLEVLPNVLLESYSAATAVIVPKVGVFKDVVLDAKTGFFYQSGNLNDLDKSINNLYVRKDLVLKMGKKAHKLYLEKYSPDRYYQELMGIYRKLILK